jgi:fatty acid desaturase
MRAFRFWQLSDALRGNSEASALHPRSADMATGFDRRNPRNVILIRVLVTAWLFGLTGILLVYGYWVWALVTLAGALANIVLAYRVWRATMR